MSIKHPNQQRDKIVRTPLSISPAPIAGGLSGEKLAEIMANVGSPRNTFFGQKPPQFVATEGAKPPPGTGESESPPAAPPAVEGGPATPSPPQENRGGRPTVMTQEMKGRVYLLLTLGLSRRQAAAYLGIVHTTIANAIERDADFAEGVVRAEQMSVIKPIITVAEASKSNWRAAAWLMRHNQRRVDKENAEEEQMPRVAGAQGNQAAETPQVKEGEVKK